jgi:HAD superfamily hydrolase (TIGR01450 family)
MATPPAPPGSTPEAQLALRAERLPERLAGVRGLLLDLDGVVILRERPIPGAAEAIAALRARGFPFVCVTNTSLVSRRTLAGWAHRLGLELPPGRIVSALSATAAWTARTHPGEPLFVITSDDGRSEFAGQRLLTPEEVDAGATASAVVVGDSPETLTPANLDRAFRLVRGGAALVGMHRNPWWLTPAGPTLDSGAYLVGLEYATGRRAVTIGKPEPGIFREAVALLRGLVSGRRLPAAAIAMVGDDIRTDVLAARRLGHRGVFVLSGKHGLADAAAAIARSPRALPDAVAPSLAEVVAALD